MAKDTQFEKNEPRALPDTKICRAVKLSEHFAECLVHRPRECRYAMPFGYVFLCGHPDRTAIAANTIAGQRKDRGPKGAT